MPEHPESLLRAAFAAAVEAADPAAAVRPHLPEPPVGRLVVVGAGKAAVRDGARGRGGVRAARASPSRARSWCDAAGRTPRARAGAGGRIAVLEAAHPVPDAAGAEATERLLALVDGAGADDHVLVLVSGGGSALLGAPAGLALADLQEVVAELLRSGADVAAMNVVRRRLGAAAGGRLAARAAPAPVTALVISDVVGDDPADVASGPTVPDPTTDRTRWRSSTATASPPRARASASRRGRSRRHRPQATRPGRACARSSWRPRGDRSRRRRDACGAPDSRPCCSRPTSPARRARPGASSPPWPSAASRAARPCAPPCAFVSGGETTVTVRGHGRGGRNSEAALGLALALPDGAPVWALCADSDGIDGTGPHAGALVGPELFRRVDRAWARGALERNDSAAVFERADALFAPGPTGTNVNDVRLLLVGRPATESGRSG